MKKKTSEGLIQTGGVRIGSGLLSFNATWPFARLRVANAELTLNCLWRRWTFPKTAIRCLRKHSGSFCSGLQIEHDVERYSKFIVFWSFSVEAL